MKLHTIKTAALAISLLCFGSASKAQWNVITQIDSFIGYHALFAPTDSTVFAAGIDVSAAKGIIVRSKDAGATWDTTLLNTYQLRSIHFPTPDTGYAVGYPTAVAKTTDGGDTWNLLNTDSLPPVVNFQSIHFTDGDNGVITAQNVPVYSGKTSDGGITWTEIPIGGWDIHFPNAQTGYTVGGNSGQKTIDGGDNWSLFGTIPNWPTGGFSCIHFINDSVGFAGGGMSAAISKTTDGGQSWNTQSLGIMLDISAIYFVNDSTGYAGGSANANQYIVLKTIDTGENWYPQQSFFPFYGASSLHCANDSVCYMAVPAFGMIYKTTNGGGALIIGIEEEKKENEITIYPNPARSKLYIKGNFDVPATFELYDITGRKIYQQQVTSNQQHVNISALAKGMYVWSLSAEQVGIDNARGKVVIE